MKVRMLSRSALLVLAISAVALPAAQSWARPPHKADAGPTGRKGARKGNKNAHERHGTAGKAHGKAGKAGKAHGKAGEAHGKAGEAHGKAGAGHGKAGAGHGKAGAGGMGAGKGAEKAAERLARIKEKAQERRARRAERAKELREKARGRAKRALKGKPMAAAVKQELRRHARRMARLMRIQTVAAEAGDAAAVARVDGLIAKEQQRHERFMAHYARKSGAPAGDAPATGRGDQAGGDVNTMPAGGERGTSDDQGAER